MLLSCLPQRAFRCGAHLMIDLYRGELLVALLLASCREPQPRPGDLVADLVAPLASSALGRGPGRGGGR